METKNKIVLGGFVVVVLVALAGAVWLKSNSEVEDTFASEEEGIKMGLGEIVFTEYTEDTRRDCDASGTCQIAIYGKQHFINESGTWKDIRDAVSLMNMNYNILMLENDSDYSIELDDFNYTCFKNLKIKSEVGGEIPFKMDEIIIANYTFEGGEEIEIEEFCVNDSIFNHNFTLGANSTTIKLLTADSENMDDSVLAEENPDFNYGAFTSSNLITFASYSWYPVYRFNISMIPAGQQIDDAQHSWYALGNNLDNNEEMDIDVYYIEAYPTYSVNSTEWTEGTKSAAQADTAGEITWITRPQGSNISGPYDTGVRATNAPHPPNGAYYNFTVTQAVADAYANGDKNVSYMFQTSNFSDNAPDRYDYIYSRLKEFGGTAADPILYITYSEAAAGDNAPTVTLSTPADDTSDTETDYNFTCNVTDDVQIDNTTLYVWHDNGTIFNQTTNTSTGTSLNYTFDIPTLEIDTYFWNCLAWDNNSASSWATNNFTLYVNDAQCWTETVGRIAIPPGCRYEINTAEGIAPS